MFLKSFTHQTIPYQPICFTYTNFRSTGRRERNGQPAEKVAHNTDDKTVDDVEGVHAQEKPREDFQT
jgi:hypothetical protein